MSSLADIFLLFWNFLRLTLEQTLLYLEKLQTRIKHVLEQIKSESKKKKGLKI